MMELAKRTMLALGETHMCAAGVHVTATPNAKHALLDRDHDAGANRVSEFEDQMMELAKRTMLALGETHMCAAGVHVTATPNAKHALLDRNHDAGADRIGEFEDQMMKTIGIAGLSGREKE